VVRALRRLIGNRALAVGSATLVAVAVLAFVVPMLRPDATLADIEHGLSAQGAPLPPSLSAPLGTDDLGRDVLARVSVAARSSLLTATVATAIALWIGVMIGLVCGLCSGWAGGSAARWIDSALMRLVDLAMSFPVLLLALFAAAALRAGALDHSAFSLAVVLGLLGWPTSARVIRAKTLVLARADFVAAARALGASNVRLILRHLLPNVRSVATVLATVTLAQMLLADAVLSFAGLGDAPPQPSWGRMVFEGRVYYRSAPWLVLVPGLAIVIAVAAFYLIGQGLQHESARDPR
jgi:peptide/nickel transport system permease protein